MTKTCDCVDKCARWGLTEGENGGFFAPYIPGGPMMSEIKRWWKEFWCRHNFKQAYEDNAVHLEICTKCGQWEKYGG